MLGVVICESDIESLKLMARAVRDLIAIDRLDADILLTTRFPQEVLNYFQEKNGLFFVTINIMYDSEPLGIDIANRIRVGGKIKCTIFRHVNCTNPCHKVHHFAS